ncbi:MAG: ABC transporter permease [Zetaproteobacteria bacterium]|nr:MAG: ABC transporter permease [Zetaproteobacteria bacterium]
MLNPVPVVVADIRRSRAGFLSVVGLIAVAVALGVAVSAQERAFRKGSAHAADAFDLLVGAPGSPTQLVLTSVYLQPAALPLVSGAVLKRLQEEPGVAYVAPVAFGDRYRGHPVIGATADFVTQAGIRTPTEGRVFQLEREAVVGADVPLRVGARFAPSHGPAVRQVEAEMEVEGPHRHDIEYVVVGKMPRVGTPWDRAIVVPVEAIWKVHHLPTGHPDGEDRIGPPWKGPEIPGVPAIVVKPKTVADAHFLRAKYRTENATALFPAEVLVELHSLLGDVRNLLAMFSVATQALVIVAVLLAVFASLALRRGKLAVLRALGASRAYVFAVVWTHVSLMIALGSGLGLVVGWAGAGVLSAAFSARTGVALSSTLALQEVVMAAAIVGIGMLLAVIPSWSSYRQTVSADLRT